MMRGMPATRLTQTSLHRFISDAETNPQVWVVFNLVFKSLSACSSRLLLSGLATDRLPWESCLPNLLHAAAMFQENKPSLSKPGPAERSMNMEQA